MTLELREKNSLRHHQQKEFELFLKKFARRNWLLARESKLDEKVYAEVGDVSDQSADVIILKPDIEALAGHDHIPPTPPSKISTPRAGETKNAKKINSTLYSVDVPKAADSETNHPDIEALVITAQTLPVATSEVKQKTRPPITRRCWNFPQCKDKKCPYTHPKTRCRNQPNCNYGYRCNFRHDNCPKDAYCEEPNCHFEHINSLPTYYRVPRDAEALDRPVASVTPLVRTISDQNTENFAEPSIDHVTIGNNQQPLEKRRKCMYYPQCRNNRSCKYWHPTEMCKNLPVGRPCPGPWCLFMHGTCPADDDCRDLKCAYEHYKSKPVLAQLQFQKKNKKSLTRATSVSNLSTCSGRSYGRRKSVTHDDDDDSDNESDGSSSVMKTLAEQQPTEVPIDNSPRSSSVTEQPTEMPTASSTRGRCHFGRRCTRKDTCGQEHPIKKCPFFPRCSNGGNCSLLHEVCENDGVCVKENCDYEHDYPHEISSKWCKNGSRCKRIGCKFIHPKECVGVCQDPDECWMYHRPGPTPRQYHGAGFQRPGYGHGSGGQAGYGTPVPPFGPPPIRYGYGPNFRPAGPPYGPGFPTGPVAGYAGYGTGGPGHVGYARGPDVFGSRLDHGQPATTPGPSPPPHQYQEPRDGDGGEKRKREKVSDRISRL